jgi:hypothetical protein
MFLSVPVSPSSLPPGPLFSLPSQLEFSIPQCPGLSHFPSCLSLFTVPSPRAWFCSWTVISPEKIYFAMPCECVCMYIYIYIYIYIFIYV